MKYTVRAGSIEAVIYDGTAESLEQIKDLLRKEFSKDLYDIWAYPGSMTPGQSVAKVVYFEVRLRGDEKHTNTELLTLRRYTIEISDALVYVRESFFVLPEWQFSLLFEPKE